jgi:uncharacterized membrane protein
MKIQFKNIKIEMIFLIFSIVFGLLWMVLLPPFQAPDEVGHFLRSYMIADGKIMCENVKGSNAGGYFPTSVIELADKVGSGKVSFHPEVKQDVNLIKNAFTLKITNVKKFEELPGMCVYNPIPYIPQSIGILLGKIIHSPVLLIFYFGRLFNLLFYIMMSFWAIKMIPKLKVTMAILALTPMALHQAASLSADGITICSSFLLISYIFYLASLERIQNKQLILLAVLGVIVTLAKIVYFPLVWLFFIIPIKLIGNKKKYILSGLAVCGASLIAFASWMLIVRTVHVIFPVDQKSQLLIIFSHPLAFAYKLIYTLLTEAGNYYSQFFGVFGWLDTPMPPLLGIAFLIVLTVSVFKEHDNCNVEKQSVVDVFKGLWILFIFLISAILIEVTLFLNFSSPNLQIIQGVQGRYFIPITFVFFWSLYYLKPSVQKYFNRIVFFGAILMFFICTFFLFRRYY